MKLKRIFAVAMATTMVMAMSITAFADGNTGVTGAGSSEGHVEKKVNNVVLPTTTENTLKYTIDPERLIQATSHDMYDADAVFPAEEADTGVYFLTGTKTYSNTSEVMEIINKSSVDKVITLTYKVTASEGGKDIAMLNAAPSGTATTAGLYLAAIVGEGEASGAVSTAALSTTAGTISKKLAGNASNFNVVVEETTSGDTTTKAYAYKQKTTGLTPWKSLKFKLTGAVTKGADIAADTTAPEVSFTWAIADVNDGNTDTPTTGVSEYEEATAVSVTVDLIKNNSGVSFIAGDLTAAVEEGESLDPEKITSVKANGVDVTEFASVGRKILINIPWNDIKAALDITNMADIDNELEMEYVYDGTTYAGTYVKQ